MKSTQYSEENITSIAMLVFNKERLITVLCNSPVHAENVAVVELCTNTESFEGAIPLRDLIHFAGLLNLHPDELYVREQIGPTLELWLYKPNSDVGFDNDPTPTDNA